MKKNCIIFILLAFIGLSFNLQAQENHPFLGDYEGVANVSCALLSIDETLEGIVITLKTSGSGYSLEVAEIEMGGSTLPAFEIAEVTVTPSGDKYILTAPPLNIIIPEITIPPNPLFPDGATLYDVPVTIKLANGIVEGNTLTLKIDVTTTVMMGPIPVPVTFIITFSGIKEEAPPHFAGKGTEQEPYLIYTPQELKILSDLVNEGNANYTDKFYKLMNNIDLSDYQKGEGWIPIGANNYAFKGNFNGNKKIITGLKIYNTKLISIGLFGQVDGGTISNLGIENADISSIIKTGNGREVGCIAGLLIGFSTMLNCYSTGLVNCVHDEAVAVAGGLTGVLFHSNISHCYSTAKVMSSGGIGVAGGLVGRAYQNSKISNSYSTGEVNSNSSVALAGFYAGGIAAYIESEYECTIGSCAALNPRISGLGDNNTEFRRVANNILSILFNNIGFSNMFNPDGETVWNYKGLTEMDGEDITAEQINANGTLGGRFKEENGWTTQNGFLPGLFGKLVDMPEHLKPNSIETITNDELQVYPNPTKGVLNLIQDRIKNLEFRIDRIEIYDVMGKKLDVEANSYGLTVLWSYDLTVFPAGVYFIKITTEQGVITKKVIKN